MRLLRQVYWDFGFGARTGDRKDDHWIDELRLQSGYLLDTGQARAARRPPASLAPSTPPRPAPPLAPLLGPMRLATPSLARGRWSLA